MECPKTKWLVCVLRSTWIGVGEWAGVARQSCIKEHA